MSKQLNLTYACDYSSRNDIVYLDRDYDLSDDYDFPRTHKAMRPNRRIIRVVIDHDATGTNTTGTGDTVVRSVPRGWHAGDRRFAA